MVISNQLLLTTCIKRTLVIIKFHHPTCQTLEMQKIATNFSIYYFSSHFFNVKIEKFVAIFHISGVWHVGWWNLITSVHY